MNINTRPVTEHITNWIAAVATATTLATLATVNTTNNQVTRLEEQGKAIKEQLEEVKELVQIQYTTPQAGKDFSVRDQQLQKIENRIERIESKLNK